MTDNSIDLQRWFLEPVRDPETKTWNGDIRVWGKAPSVEGRKKWWRSSTIRARVSSNKLKTRHGTIVHLQGHLCISYAKRTQMREETVDLFRNGFPVTWRRFLRDAFDITHEKKQITPRRSTRNKQDDKKNLIVSVLKKQTQKRPRKKRVAFADYDSSKQNKPKQPTSAVTRSKTKRDKDEDENNEIEQSNKNLKENEWTSEQRNAFEVQRNRTNADDPNYWEQVAKGVKGKTATQCQTLWESSWNSPTNIKKSSTKDTKQSSKSQKDSTPTMIKRVMDASKQKRSRSTAKYRTDVRRMVDTLARDADDDVLEPRIETPKMDSIVKAKVENTANVSVPSLNEGTPGSEVRRKRAEAEKDGILPTPEIIARGRSFGLSEADHYVSLFKRRLGVGSTSTVVPNLKKTSAKPSTSRANMKGKKPSSKGQSSQVQQPRDDDSEEDGDMFF